MTPTARSLLFPHQVGVGVSAGCEAVIHSVRDCLWKNSHRTDMVMLKIDFTNAFNMIDRRIFLSEIAAHFPEIYNWVHLCYAHDSILNYDGHEIISSCGVQQGDPLGPLLFAFGLSKLTSQINEHCKLLMNIWYCDDGVLVGEIDEVQKALSLVTVEGKKIGLHVNLNKCELHWPNNVDLSIFDSSIRRTPQAGVDLLGSHIGTKDSLENFLESKVDSLSRLLQDLHDLNYSQAEFAILKNCLRASKLNHVLRTCIPGDSPSLSRLDNIQRMCLEKILSKSLTDTQWQQACLPTKLGGLGIRPVHQLHLPAYLASRIFTWITSSALSSEILNLRDSRFFNDASHSFTELYPSCQLEDLLGMGKGLQKILSSYTIKSSWNDVIEQLDTLSKANNLSFNMPHATDYLNVLPRKKIGLFLTNEEFRLTVSRQLRLPVSGRSSMCPLCNTAVLDVYGDHALVCTHSGDRIARHNSLRDVIYYAFKAAGSNPNLEVMTHLCSQSRAGDVFVRNWSLGKALAIDVTVTSPLQSTFYSKAAVELGYASKQAESKKLAYAEHLVNDSDTTFVPVAFETSGGVGEMGIGLLKELANRCADTNFRDRAQEKQHLFQRLNLTLHRYNANMLIARHSEKTSVLYYDKVAMPNTDEGASCTPCTLPPPTISNPPESCLQFSAVPQRQTISEPNSHSRKEPYGHLDLTKDNPEEDLCCPGKKIRLDL